MDELFPATSMPDRDWWAVLWPRPAEVLTDLGIRPDMTVLDLCCGDGYFTAPLARLVDGRVYALDLDAGMIEQAKIEVERVGGTVCKWINADAREIASLLSEPVDYVLMANTFHGVPDKPGLARAVRHILRPGGLFAIVNWHPIPREQTVVLGQPRGPRTDMRMSPDSVQRSVEPAGFSTARIAELPPYHYGIILERT
ncbi:class I SAM-dependent methyltransferase [Rhizobium leucaenae]|uniref:SAM-dependent methyltransferase n=1 Tax=Rhizobium leucaenae TaxID=29450 RepID=A0A7W7EIM7_9HYPH|nr:class I SAM-dependent methyltransferase [Rhizobium leucaenae]MBB4566926.1 SAM-dependent methyltransferase [Rhizobium leucaenae]MBB6300735.1 SAM-dependent methyltransferase [Rhizobium leucaenae]